jgi:hypothetical protein
VDSTKQIVATPGKSRCNVLPENFQEALYSGHKRPHCFNNQGAVTPDGLLIHFFGSFDGRRHDSTIMIESGLMNVLDSCALLNDFLVYGDPAYGCRGKLVCGFKGSNLSPVRFCLSHYNYLMILFTETASIQPFDVTPPTIN